MDFGADVNRPIVSIEGETTLHHAVCDAQANA
jgi:hypothetical protein